MSSRSTDGLGPLSPSACTPTWLSVMRTWRFAGTTNTTPGCRGSRSTTVRTGRVVRRPRMSPRRLGRVGSRCWAITSGAGKSGGSVETSLESASIPPAEAPTTTSCDKGAASAIV